MAISKYCRAVKLHNRRVSAYFYDLRILADSALKIRAALGAASTASRHAEPRELRAIVSRLLWQLRSSVDIYEDGRGLELLRELQDSLRMLDVGARAPLFTDISEADFLLGRMKLSDRTRVKTLVDAWVIAALLKLQEECEQDATKAKIAPAESDRRTWRAKSVAKASSALGYSTSTLRKWLAEYDCDSRTSLLKRPRDERYHCLKFRVLVCKSDASNNGLTGEQMLKMVACDTMRVLRLSARRAVKL